MSIMGPLPPALFLFFLTPSPICHRQKTIYVFYEKQTIKYTLVFYDTSHQKLNHKETRDPKLE